MRRAVAATTVARKASTGVIRELSTSETASYSQMIARTIRVSGTEPFQSAAIRGYRGSQELEIAYECETKCQNAEARMACKTKPNSRPSFPSGSWRLNAKYWGYSGKQANPTGHNHNQTLGRWYALYAGSRAGLTPRGKWVKAPEP
eukprot:4424284-Pleurochrysis_carterae.AAC.1